MWANHLLPDPKPPCGACGGSGQLVILDPSDIKGTIGAPSPCPLCSISGVESGDTTSNTPQIDPAIAADPDWPNRAVGGLVRIPIGHPAPSGTGELDKTYMDLLNLLSISIL